MELYNFYSEQISKTEYEKVNNLKLLFNELKDIFKTDFISLVERDESICLIGQISGEDTNIGDTQLFSLFSVSDIKYYYFNAYYTNI